MSSNLRLALSASAQLRRYEPDRPDFIGDEVDASDAVATAVYLFANALQGPNLGAGPLGTTRRSGRRWMLIPPLSCLRLAVLKDRPSGLGRRPSGLAQPRRWRPLLDTTCG